MISSLTLDPGTIFLPALEQVMDAVVIIDEAGRVIFFNAAAERLWGRDRDGILGQDAAQLHLLPVDAADGSRELRIIRQDDSVRWGAVSLSRAAAGGRTIHVGFIRDVTGEVARREELYLLSLVANETDRVVIVTGADRRIVYVNRAFTEMFGYALAEVRGQLPTELLAGKRTDPKVLGHLRRRAGVERGFHVELLTYAKSGEEIWVSTTVNTVLNTDGTLKNIVAVLADITENKQIEALQRDVLEALAKDTPLQAIMDMICLKVEAIASGVICTILLVDQDRRLHPLAGPSLPEPYSSALDGLEIGPEGGSCGTAAYFGIPVVVEDIATDPLWRRYRDLVLPLGLAACWSSPIRLRDGRVAGTFAFYFREKRGPSPWHEHVVNACTHLCALAIERHEAKTHIAHLAYFDTLTGLPNRARLHQYVDSLIGTPDAGSAPVAFLFLDIDHFKDVNDTLGHSVGDLLLVEVAQRLQTQLRPTDVVSRLGGDEFVFILPHCDAEGAALVAKRAIESLSEPFTLGAMPLSISVSIGISLYPDNGRDKETLLKHADAAMYEAKGAGRGTYRFFSPEMNQPAQERLVVTAALREALLQGGLELHYQPQLRLQDGRLHGVEALLRWTHPTLGSIAPSRFIPLAEENGMIEAVGEWCLREACRQAAAWHRAGLAIGTVSVNLSSLHFRSAGLPGLIAAELKAHGVAPGMLTIEVTESVMMDERAAVLDTVRAVRALGVGLSMDDFGTGYSSLGSLTRLPVTELKIDRSFVRDLGQDEQAEAVARAVIRIGRSLGMTVVAEGVETAAQWQMLKALRCEAAQGLLFAPALAAPALEAWLAGQPAAAPLALTPD
ncbi:MAG TPA: EAL domain-containing protein [Roseomonas sp.]